MPDVYNIAVTVGTNTGEVSRNRSYQWVGHDVPVSTVVTELETMTAEVIAELEQ